jgi:hypothetical protein
VVHTIGHYSLWMTLAIVAAIIAAHSRRRLRGAEA